MQDVMTVTPVEWILFALAGVALVNSAVICMNMHKNLVRADARQPLHGFRDSLSDLGRRANRKPHN